MQTLSSVQHALRILLVMRERGDLGVSDAARSLGISSSSAHRLLITLQAEGFVEQVRAGGKYRLGPVMQHTATAVDRVIQIASPHMAQLRDSSLETVHLAALSATETRFLAAFESPRVLRVTSRVGRSLPAHATAAGKLLLSYSSDDGVRALYPAGPIPGGTAASAVDVDALLGEIRDIRSLGFGRNRSEAEDGVAALAVPILDAAGRAFFALTVTGPDANWNPERTAGLSPREQELLATLRATAVRIETELSDAVGGPSTTKGA